MRFEGIEIVLGCNLIALQSLCCGVGRLLTTVALAIGSSTVLVRLSKTTAHAATPFVKTTANHRMTICIF